MLTNVSNPPLGLPNTWPFRVYRKAEAHRIATKTNIAVGKTLSFIYTTKRNIFRFLKNGVIVCSSQNIKTVDEIQYI